MTSPLTRTDTAARYEELRAAVLPGQAEGWRLGWGVLTGRGMAAWTAAQREIPGQVPVVQQQEPGRRPVQSTTVPTGQAAELVRVLAGMALAALRPEHHHPARDQGEDCEHQRRQHGGQGQPRAPAA